jgi:hypothetical protein
VFKAAVKVLMLLSRCQGAVEVLEAAVEVSRLLSRCEAAVEVLMLLPKC